MPLWLTIKDFIIYINMFKTVIFHPFLFDFKGTILSGFWSSDLWFLKKSSEDSTHELTCSGVHQAFGEELNEPINPQYRTVQMEDSDEDEVPNESKWNQTEVLPTPFSPNFGKKTNNEIQNIAR